MLIAFFAKLIKLYDINYYHIRYRLRTTTALTTHA